MARKKYDPRLVDVVFVEEHPSTWKWNNRSIRGIEAVYQVTDRNFGKLNCWEFGIQVPTKPGQLIVRPRTIPSKKAFAGLDRRSIIFRKTTKNPHRSKLYCKLNIADATGERTKIGTRRGERDILPRWFKYFRPHMRLKLTVTTTEGTDGKAQVCLVAPDDYERMIRLFFALRVWFLQERLSVK